MIYQHLGVSFDNRTVISDKKMHILAIVYISSLSLSLIGSGSVIVVSVIKKRYLDEQILEMCPRSVERLEGVSQCQLGHVLTESTFQSILILSHAVSSCFVNPPVQARPLFQLALADFLAAAALLATSTIEILPAKLLALCRFCPYGMALAMSFYCTVFLLVMVYAYEAKQAVQGWREASDPDSQQESHCRRKKKTLYLLYFLAWSLPALGFLTKVITILNSATEIVPGNLNVTNCFYCSSCILVLIHNDVCGPQETWKENLMKILFFLYVLVVLTSCTVVYCKVRQWCRRQQEGCLLLVEGDGFNSRNIRGIYVTARCILLVFLICWTPAFVLVLLGLLIHDVSPQSLHFLYILQVLQASTMPLQGFLDSIAYGWFRRNFREVALGERVALLANVHSRAFYDESLTT